MKKICKTVLAAILLIAILSTSLTAVPALAAGNDWQNAYADIIYQHYKNKATNQDAKFAIADMDFDGVPELCVGYGRSDYQTGNTTTATAYSYKSGRVEQIQGEFSSVLNAYNGYGSVNGWSLYLDKNSGYKLVAVDVHSEGVFALSYKIYAFSVKENTVKVQTLLSEDVPYNVQEAWYNGNEEADVDYINRQLENAVKGWDLVKPNAYMGSFVGGGTYNSPTTRDEILAYITRNTSSLPKEYANLSNPALTAQQIAYAPTILAFYDWIETTTRMDRMGSTAFGWLDTPYECYYAFYDIDKNGVSEMIFTDHGKAIGEIYTLHGGKAVKLTSFAERSYCIGIYEDGRIASSWANSAFDSGINTSRIASDGSKMEFISAVDYDDIKGLKEIELSFKSFATLPRHILENAGTINAVPTNTTFMLNGAEVALPAYTIADNNYVKLRDVAALLVDRFDVRYEDGKAKLYNYAKYTSVGGELAPIGTASKAVKPSQTDFVWGDTGAIVTELTAYNIGDNNYIKLRDIAKLFNFDVDWHDGKAWIEPDVSPYTED